MNLDTRVGAALEAAGDGAGLTGGAGRRMAMPSLELLRSLTDEHVLRALMDHRQLTRAGISARTGISKPTVSESVRRLDAAGVLRDTGERTSGPGRAGSYYTLSDAAGSALVVSVHPDVVWAEAVDPFGTTVDQCTIGLRPGSGHEEAARALGEAARSVLSGARPFRTAAVSAADPVDRTSGRLVQLPDAPFLVGDLDPVAALAGVVSGPILVDNDVNWAARAERDAGQDLPGSFVYLYLGAGLGCAVVADGEVIRGQAGLAGEIAHLMTAGPRGRAMPLTEVFAELGLRRPGTTAIDVDLLRSRLGRSGSGSGSRSGGAGVVRELARALAGVVAAAIAFADPGAIVLGGSWGSDPGLVAALAQCVATAPRAVALRTATHADRPDHAGARLHALSELRARIAARPNIDDPLYDGSHEFRGHVSGTAT